MAVALAELVKLEDPVVAEVLKAQLGQVHLMKVMAADLVPETELEAAEELEHLETVHQDLVTVVAEEMVYNLQSQDHKLLDLVAAVEVVKEIPELADKAVADKVVHTQLVQHLQEMEHQDKQTLEAVEVDLTTTDLSVHQDQAVVELFF